MSDDTRRTYPPLSENTYIGAFLVGVGYHAAACGLPVPISALVQQSGKDSSTGDLALNLNGRNYLFEFKRHGNRKGIAKEIAKSDCLWEKLAEKQQAALALGGEDEGKHLLETSRQCHVFSLSGIAWERQKAPPWELQPYLERFPAPAGHALAASGDKVAPPIDLATFVRNYLFADPKNASPSSAGMRGAGAAEFTAYIGFLCQALTGETGQLGGLVINIDDAGHVTPVIFENLADLTLENGQLPIAPESQPKPSPPKSSMTKTI